MNRAHSKAVWKQRNGQKIMVRDMTISHLENTIAMLERVYSSRCENLALSAWAYASNAPDGAAMAAEQEAERAMKSADTADGIERDFPIYPELCAELEWKKKP